MDRCPRLSTWSYLVTLLIVATLMPGCGGSQSGGPADDDMATATQRTADCATTSADALVSLVTTDSGLSASAVTSSCDEVAIYKEDGAIKTVSIIDSTDTSKGVVAEFDEDGRLIVALERETGDTVTATYNEGLSYARVAEDIADTVSASILAVPRDDGTAARSSAGNTRFEFCEQLEQFVFIVSAECADSGAPARCVGPFAEAAATARELCTAGEVVEVEQIENLKTRIGDDIVPLGIDGFVTTRPAAAGTTFIMSAVGYGGVPPYDVTWSQVDGPATAMTQMPGGAAVGDSTTASGRYTFMAQVRDGDGALASTEVPVDLGEAFIGVVAQASTKNPEVGAPVTFFAAPADTLTAAGSIDTTASAGGLEYDVFWDFGDGSPGAGGESVEHTYSAPGVYTVSLIVVAGVCDFNDTLTIRVGAEDGADDEVMDDGVADFHVAISSTTAALSPGGSTVLEPVVSGGTAPIEFGWGIIEGQQFVDKLGPVSVPNAQMASSESVELKVDSNAEGVIVVGLVAFDATGRVAESALPLPVCGGDDTLFAHVLGPFDVKVNEPAVIESAVIQCSGQGDGLNYRWSIEQGAATLSNDRAQKPSLTASAPGELIVVRMQVSDTAGRTAEASIGIRVLSQNADDLFAEFLGPHEVPVEKNVPVFSFIAGGEPPYFCSWHVHGAPQAIGAFLDPFECKPKFKAFGPGCVSGELRVEDVTGREGLIPFEICAGAGFEFDCPPDGFCDPSCDGFDPDCDDPCPLDGVCDEACPIGDPDCFQEGLCLPDDGVCHPFCADQGQPDPECALCGPDGVCVFLCPVPDPDCDFIPCQPFDGICDFGCPQPDPDCAGAGGDCLAGDGFCDLFCPAPDPDCPQDNDTVCFEAGLCCAEDTWCDPNCPQPDTGCTHCGLDGVCSFGCFPTDPDCPCDPASEPNCGGFCGDGLCDLAEHCSFCPMDCGPCSSCMADADCFDPDPCKIGVCETIPGSTIGECIFQGDPNCTCQNGECPPPCPPDGFCQDGDPCTVDVCENGFCYFEAQPDCTGGCDPMMCDDFDPCTSDSCDPAGQCVHEVLPDCDGSCEVAADCDDFDPCTVDHCDSASGLCIHDTQPNCCPPGVTCDDFDPCTVDGCDSAGQCQFTPMPNCGGGGTCVNTADCDDLDTCTIDTCDPNGVCKHDPTPDCMPCNTSPGCDPNCPEDPDCAGGPMCGNGVCEPPETPGDCPADCM